MPRPLVLDSPPLVSRNPVGPSALVQGVLRPRDLAPSLLRQNQVQLSPYCFVFYSLILFPSPHEGNLLLTDKLRADQSMDIQLTIQKTYIQWDICVILNCGFRQKYTWSTGVALVSVEMKHKLKAKLHCLVSGKRHKSSERPTISQALLSRPYDTLVHSLKVMLACSLQLIFYQMIYMYCVFVMFDILYSVTFFGVWLRGLWFSDM